MTQVLIMVKWDEGQVLMAMCGACQVPVSLQCSVAQVLDMMRIAWCGVR